MEGRKRDAHRTLYQKLWQRHRGWEGRKEKWKEERCTPNTPQETGRDTEGGKEGRKNGRKEERSTQNTLPAETQECYITRPSI